MRAQPENSTPYPEAIAAMLRGELKSIVTWAEQWSNRRLLLHVSVVILGAGLYGAAMGWWRDPQQALFTAVKFPLVILLTVAGNTLLNSMLAPLLGLNLPFRQSFSAILMSFVIASVILGAFSPVVAFLIWNAPGMASKVSADSTYSVILLVHVAVIALAGVTGSARLFQLLMRLGGNRAVASRVLLAWLAGNLFLGSQLSWILRPFIGSPGLPVEFLRATAFRGNFYEAVFHSCLQIFNN
jgi:hypothetical protein